MIALGAKARKLTPSLGRHAGATGREATMSDDGHREDPIRRKAVGHF